MLDREDRFYLLGSLMIICIIIFIFRWDAKPINHRFDPETAYQVESDGSVSTSLANQCRKCEQNVAAHESNN